MSGSVVFLPIRLDMLGNILNQYKEITNISHFNKQMILFYIMILLLPII